MSHGRTQDAKTAFDPLLANAFNLPPISSFPSPLLPLSIPLVCSSGDVLTCKRAVAQALSLQMTSAVRFDLVSARLGAIGEEIAAGGECSVEVVEFAPRQMLGSLVSRAWGAGGGQQPPISLRVFMG